jgi:hypothetical protein
MALPSNWDLVPVRGKYVGADGNPVAGRVIFTPRVGRMVDTSALTTIVGRPITVVLDGTGAFAVNLPATNDPDILPTGFSWTVKEDFTGGSTYDIDVPLSAVATGLDLSTVAPVPPNSGGSLAVVTRLEFDALSATVAAGGGGGGTGTGGAVSSVSGKTGAVTLTKADVGLDQVNNTSDSAKPISTAAQLALQNKADLVGGVIPDAQLPPLALQDTFVVASQSAMLAANAQKGDVAVRTDQNKSYRLSQSPASTLSNWIEIPAAGAVASVAGKTGTVALVKADVGLANVDNTSDANKPVSTAQATALAAKADKSGTLRQFADVDPSAPTDGVLYVFNGTDQQFEPVDPASLFAFIDANGRLASPNWPKYLLPQTVLDQNQALPSDFPVGGLVYERAVVPSLAPILEGTAFLNNLTGAQTTVAASPADDLEVGEWVGIALTLSDGDTTSSVVNSVAVSAGTFTATPTQVATVYKSGTTQIFFWIAKVATLIPHTATITATLAANEAHRILSVFKLPNLAASSPIDVTPVTTSGNSSSSVFDYTVGPTATTAQASEVAIMIVSHNDSTTEARPVTGTNGWNVLSAVESDNGTNSRTQTVLYKVLSATGAVSGTFHVGGTSTGAWAAMVATLKGA